jgi:hypothetical protein
MDLRDNKYILFENSDIPEAEAVRIHQFLNETKFINKHQWRRDETLLFQHLTLKTMRIINENPENFTIE